MPLLHVPYLCYSSTLVPMYHTGGATIILEKPKEQSWWQDHQEGVHLLHTYGQLKISFGFWRSSG